MFYNKYVYFAFIAGIALIKCVNGQTYTFPTHFKFGTATASYQIEGGWNEDGKGENIWDRFSHTQPEKINNGSTGDVACDSYHLFEKDLNMLTELGVDFYRFSLSWSRILPTGFGNIVNQPGIDYYNKIIDGLIARNITPVITIYHWDLPQPIEDLGGWENELIVDYFSDYSNIVFAAFGDRVKTWITINEPMVLCNGYSTNRSAPGYNSHGIGDYLCIHNILKAHAKAYHLYDSVYRNYHIDAKIGITLSLNWYEPLTGSEEHKIVAERSNRFEIGLCAHPIYSLNGDYPPELRAAVDKNSANQGYSRSRMPYFTSEEVEYIKGSADFFGINHYTTNYVQEPNDDSEFIKPSFTHDMFVQKSQDKSWPSAASQWLKAVPYGFRNLLNWIKDEYGNPRVYIFENGFSTFGGLEDDDRIYYLREYLKALSQAINEDGCQVDWYTVWSLMDNFEWSQGYSERFGLFEVDYENPEKTRTMRKSGFFYRDVIQNRAVLNKETDWSNSIKF